MIKQILRTKRFKKMYNKLSKTDRTAVDKTLELFLAHPFDKKLRNHALKGELKGIRFIDVLHDLRIHYREEDGHVVVFLLRVGTHAQLYRI